MPKGPALIPSLKASLKEHLLAALSRVLRLCGGTDWMTSSESIPCVIHSNIDNNNQYHFSSLIKHLNS